MDLYDRRLGDGDVTAESLWPYPRHTRAVIETNQDVPSWGIRLIEEIMRHGDPSLVITTEDREEASFVPVGKVATLEGNGQAILTGWQIARPVVGLLTTIQGKIQSVVDDLKSLHIGVTHNRDLPVGYDRLMRFAVEQGGGVSFPTRLDEMVYLSADHIVWAGSAKEALLRTLQEIGDSRNLIKVAVEITNPEHLSQMENIRVDLIYCRKFTADDIRRVKNLIKGRIKMAVDETIPVEDLKSLTEAGIRMYMVNLNALPASPELLSIRFVP